MYVYVCIHVCISLHIAHEKMKSAYHFSIKEWLQFFIYYNMQEKDRKNWVDKISNKKVLQRVNETKTRWLYCVECPQYSTQLEPLVVCATV